MRCFEPTHVSQNKWSYQYYLLALRLSSGKFETKKTTWTDIKKLHARNNIFNKIIPNMRHGGQHSYSDPLHHKRACYGPMTTMTCGIREEPIYD